MNIYYKRNTGRIVLMILIMSLMIFSTGCTGNDAPAVQPDQAKPNPIVLATTTSTQQTGLLDTLVPEFTKETGIEVKVVAVGTGQALEMGKTGDADVLLVHAKASEEEFVKEGYGLARYDVMYNDFVLVGPENAAASIPDQFKNDIVGAMNYIQENKIPFVSRGDKSGTNTKELSLWKEVGVEPSGDWYLSIGKGMGETLQFADEKKGYTLSDRGTYLSMKDKLGLQIVVEKSQDLFNQYGVIAVNPEKNPGVHVEEAQKFVNWILSKNTQQIISQFGVEQFGQPLFVPNAK